jgi:hypothetical protein
MQRLERPSQAEIAERARGYFRWRFKEAVEVLPADSAKLAEVLSEMIALVIGEEEVEGWQPPALEEVLRRLTEPLAYGAHP